MKTLKFMLAAATAIGLASATQADQYNTTGFEKLTVGDPVTTGVEDNRSGYSYFYYAGAIAEDNESVIAAGTPDIARPRGAASVDATQNNILQVSTGTDPLVRTFAPLSSGAPQAATTLASDTYIDTLVQFTVTPYTDTVTPSNGVDKLMIYLKECTNGVAEVTGTNLVVIGGYYTGSTSAREYILSDGTNPITVEPNTWHRLTVKAVVDLSGEDALGFPAFQIWVDGTLCRLSDGVVVVPTYDPESEAFDTFSAFADASNIDAGLYVLSLQAGKGQSGKLQGVGFAGEGKVDDIVFSTVDPFATVFDFTFALGTGVSAVTYTVGGTEYDQARTFPEVEAGTEIEVTSITYTDAYMEGTRAAVNLSDPVEGVYTVTNAGASLTITPAEAYASIGDTKYGTFAEAISGATAGQTVTLLRDAAVSGNTITTAAGTLDLNGKTLTLPQNASKVASLTFTGTGAATLKGGDLTGSYHELTIKVPDAEDLTFDGMTFHASVKPEGLTNSLGEAGILLVTNCQFLCDFDKTGTAFTDGSSADVHSYGLMFQNATTQFKQADVVNNYFDQGRRAAVQACISGDLYFYGNTVVADKLTSRYDGAGTRYPALQTMTHGRVFIENNTFSGQYLGEAFCLYNKDGYRSTDAAVVFSGNTVGNGVNYLWGISDALATGSAPFVNPNLYFGANTIDANVNTTQCVYKTTIDGTDVNGVTYSHTPATLALPTGVDSVYAWTHAAGAKDFYVNGTAAADLSSLDANDVVLAVPGADVSGASLTLTPDSTYKNKWTASAGGAADWVADPETITPGTSAATQYSDLAGTALATADAKELTEWAATNKVAFADVTTAMASSTPADVTLYTEAFLLNCAPTSAAVADEKEDFVLDISVAADGTITVSLPEGKKYNGTLQMKGSNDLSTWNNVEGASSSYKFYKYELSL